MNFTFDRRGSTERLRPAPSYSHPVTFKYEIQNHTSRMEKLTKAFKVYRLMVTTLVCVVAGLVIGIVSRPYAKDWEERHFMYIELPASQLAKVAGFLYLCSNLLAIVIAIVLAILICPGRQYALSDQKQPQNYKQFAGHHYFNEYHDSIIRYREYHPMFYHTSQQQQQQNGQADGVILDAEEGQLPSSIVKVKENITLEELDKDGRLMDVVELDTEREESLPPPPPPPVAGMSRYHLVASQEPFEGPSMPTATEINRIGLSTKLPIDVLLDVLRNLVPDSLVGATLQQTRTRLFAPKELIIYKNGTLNPQPSSWPMGHDVIGQANIIGLLAMSVLTGIVLSHMEEASRPMLDLCACISELSLRVGMKAINVAPICIMFLLIGQLARSRDLSSMAGELIMYTTTVIVALVFHGFVVLPLLYYVITKKSPFAFFLGMLEALVASFATSSSSATMALMLNCLSDLQLNMVIVRAFGPLGSVFNMNGTAIYEAIAVIFIAQTLGVTLPLTSLLLVGLSSAVASLSTSGIPSSGLMTMVIVLNAINMPVLQLSLIYIVDFIIDRFRTVVNVWSGSIVCGIIDHICPEHLFEEEMKPDKYREMLKYRSSRGSLGTRKSLAVAESPKPQVISVTITPPSSDLQRGTGSTGSSTSSGTSTSVSITSSRV